MIERKTQKQSLSDSDKYIRGLRLAIPHLLRKRRSKCVDPREPDIAKPREKRAYKNSVARPGGDMGYAMALMGAFPDMQPEHAVDITYGWVLGQEKRRFSTHTDTHAHGPKCGCGHIDRVTGNEARYGLTQEQMTRAYDRHQTWQQTQLQTSPDTIEHRTLQNDHRERVVVVNMSRLVTVPQAIDGIEAFRYDKKEDQKRLTRLADYLAQQRYVNGSRQEIRQKLQTASDRQLQATLELLAPGLPIIETRLLRRVRRVGTVPTAQTA